MNVVTVNDVSVRYITGDLRNVGFKEWIMQSVRTDRTKSEFWAIKNITFSLEKGDFLGVIGVNGAGKSTLSKVIAGVIEPTEGFCETHGKMASIISMGAGFDGDLTISENVYLRGAYLGLSKRFMTEKHDEIIQFAELWDYRDQPFRILSSGMQSRLGVSITTLIEPDILILDEAFAGGDALFRERAQARMTKMLGTGNVTTIMVSHGFQMLQVLANKILWLDKGERVAFGTPQEIFPLFHEFAEKNKFAVNK
jgi:ABC-2 type transport system ATP-binding protein